MLRRSVLPADVFSLLTVITLIIIENFKTTCNPYASTNATGHGKDYEKHLAFTRNNRSNKYLHTHFSVWLMIIHVSLILIRSTGS